MRPQALEVDLVRENPKFKGTDFSQECVGVNPGYTDHFSGHTQFIPFAQDAVGRADHRFARRKSHRQFIEARQSLHPFGHLVPYLQTGEAIDRPVIPWIRWVCFQTAADFIGMGQNPDSAIIGSGAQVLGPAVTYSAAVMSEG